MPFSRSLWWLFKVGMLWALRASGMDATGHCLAAATGRAVAVERRVGMAFCRRAKERIIMPCGRCDVEWMEERGNGWMGGDA